MSDSAEPAVVPPPAGPDEPVARLLRIHGQVQGVGFRWSLMREAERLGGLSGWVRNRRDGSVEALACGPHGQVVALLDWARRGPPQARVEHVQVEEHTGTGQLAAGFTQAPTM